MHRHVVYHFVLLHLIIHVNCFGCQLHNFQQSKFWLNLAVRRQNSRWPQELNLACVVEIVQFCQSNAHSAYTYILNNFQWLWIGGVPGPPLGYAHDLDLLGVFAAKTGSEALFVDCVEWAIVAACIITSCLVLLLLFLLWRRFVLCGFLPHIYDNIIKLQAVAMYKA